MTGRSRPEVVRGPRRPAPPDLRPLDPMQSIKAKLGVLVTASVVVASLVVWWGVYNSIGPRWTLPLAILGSLLLTQLLARGMTSPLREMTAAATAMSHGDYSKRVRATSGDEVGHLAMAFNRMAEDLATADRQRRELVANVSHELRTPVSALRAQLENMVDGVTAPDRETLSAALHQTERLGTLVKQLLDLSRLEAGVVPLDAHTIAVAPFLADAVESAQMVASGVGREVIWQVEVSPRDLTVYADLGRLHQVIANLLDNASRHSPPGGTVRVTATRLGPRDGRAVRFDVVDQGPGIAPEDRSRVFERFHRGGSQSTGGTGLGLAIARWAVELHGGTIQVEDAPSGCHIAVVLPAAGV